MVLTAVLKSHSLLCKELGWSLPVTQGWIARPLKNRPYQIEDQFEIKVRMLKLGEFDK